MRHLLLNWNYEWIIKCKQKKINGILSLEIIEAFIAGMRNITNSIVTCMIACVYAFICLIYKNQNIF